MLGLLPQLIPLIPGVIAGVEKLFPGHSGPDKKSAAVMLVQSFVPLLEGVFLHKDVVDDALFAEAVGNLIDGVYKLEKAINREPKA